jgi:hypothetical protein
MTEVEEFQIKPFGVGIRNDPPSMYCFYNSTLGQRRRRMPFRPIMEAIEKKKSVVDVDEVVKYMVKRHHFYAQCISEEKLRGYVCEVLKHHKIQPKVLLPVATVPPPALKTTTKPMDAPVEDQAKSELKLLSKEVINSKNLNILKDEELKQVKEVMDIDFKKNQIKKEDPGFQYDLKKDFGTPKEKSDWDSDSDEKHSKPVALGTAPIPGAGVLKALEPVIKPLAPLQKELAPVAGPIPLASTQIKTTVPTVEAPNPVVVQKELASVAAPIPIVSTKINSVPPVEAPNQAIKPESKPALVSEEPKKPKPKNEIDALLDTFEKSTAGNVF